MTLPPFQLLVDAHWRDVARLAHALAGPVDGDDVAQQAWTQALAAYPSLRSAANLRGWLLTITSRCAMDAHRGRARRAVPAEDVADLSAASRRTAVVLKYVADLDHPTIARVLDTSPTMSRRLVSDALSTLRKAVP